ncbi:MAG: polyprenyl synthetase family protein, partial [Micrococcales bacterium]|nr:polyprenyl synthetase family protein [Micrococcales bacterium]
LAVLAASGVASLATRQLFGFSFATWRFHLRGENIRGAHDIGWLREMTVSSLMRREVTIGQFLDVAEESAYVTEADDRHAERALRVASLKSARYSIQQPLVIGAAIAGADAAQRAALIAFGHPVGMAFQLRDDVLGVFGDAESTGKPSGDDLREGKRTVLVAYTREALSPGSRRLFDEMLGDPTLEPEQIAAMQQTIRETGALERVEALIADYTRTAERALSGVPLGNRSVSELRDLARAATVRTT